ncbi:class I SAM-dependent methyltransferase [Kangiella shandongensis]|uniref:class I SAM-dependent methyltransferase n=1 Tax=Kangiella shandongensis TaxID=2763258 RepID=UPI001CBEDBC7|nr:SAM-dependent methyltransferase [Kangiella shandongensis]
MSVMDSSRFPTFCCDRSDYQQLIEEQCRTLELPEPNSAAVDVSFALAQKVSELINLKQKIPFSDFMQQALYAPGLGYYSAGSYKLGAQGDFVTAPELSPLFGKTLAQSIMQAFEHTQPVILELGAGSGRLMCDLLRQLEVEERVPETYYILEVSAELRQRQQQLLKAELPHLVTKVVWLDKLPQSFKGVIIGNEVIDAIPFELLMKTEHGLAQGFVKYNERGFSLEFHVTDYSRGWQKRNFNSYSMWPEGYLVETSELRNDWMRTLMESLEQGCVILLDYGYEQEELYSPYRPQGTLQCYYRQRKHSTPLALLGLQDITCSVNFTQLAETAQQQGSDILGFTSQALFLTLSGIEQFVAQAQDSDTIAGLSVAQQLQTLLMPAEMGQTIKVLGLSKNFSGTLSGFKSL